MKTRAEPDARGPDNLLTENRELRALIADEIRRDGPITFAAFMTAALYHPELGYYSSLRHPIGRQGDYVTSPEVSGLFGRLMAKHIAATWEAAGSPPRWSVVELGGGSGRMAADILAALAADSPPAAAAIEYSIIESSEALRGLQGLTLRRFPNCVRWLKAVSELENGFSGHVISNEYFDALPVHRVRLDRGELREVYVGLNASGAFVDVVGEPSTPALSAYFGRLGLLPGEGCLAEVNLKAVEHMNQVTSRLSKGAVTTLDYGYEAARLYAPWRKQGTLLCFYQQAFSDDPFRRVGRQDITAHVDFTSLAASAGEQGWTSSELMSQAEFLGELGINQLGAAAADLEERMALRRARELLVDPAGLGRVRVLVLQKARG